MDNVLASLNLADLFNIGQTADRYDWAFFREGIDIARIYEGADGISAALLRYAPGARVPRHEHAGYEHILVLSGSQSDEQGHYTKGSLLISKPGSAHSVASDEGCIVLGIWQLPVIFREGEKLGEDKLQGDKT